MGNSHGSMAVLVKFNGVPCSTSSTVRITRKAYKALQQRMFMAFFLSSTALQNDNYNSTVFMGKFTGDSDRGPRAIPWLTK